MERKTRGDWREGKTKIIRPKPGYPDRVLVISKDEITAGDGEKKDSFPGKGRFSTQTTCNCFELLKRLSLPTGYIGRVSTNVFEASYLDMVPVEAVFRRIGTGSWLKRNPKAQEGTVFDPLVVEFFLKDDANHDPFMVFSKRRKSFLLYNPKKPISWKSKVGEISVLLQGGVPLGAEEIKLMASMGMRAFQVLELAWARLEVTLYDLKLEMGQLPNGRIVIGDVIDNDSWRIRKKGVQMDKQVYRDGGDLETVAERYAWVAEQTGMFKNIF